MPMRACAVALSIAASSLLAVTSRAQPESGATLVAIVTAEPLAPLTRRVKAELQALGVDVLVLRPPAEASTSRAPLEQAARNVGAVAAVRLVVSGEGKIEVWVADRVTGKAVVRELDARAGAASDEAVAIGTVELLRASLMELHSAVPPHGDVPVTPKVEALALPSTGGPLSPRLGLSVSGGAELGLGGLGPSPDVSLGLWFPLLGGLGLHVTGHLSLAPSHVVTTSGAVDVQSQLVGVTARYDLADATSTWAPSLEGGMGTAHVASTGTAAPPFLGATDGRWYATPLAGAGLAWSAARGLRIRGDMLGAWAIPSAEVRTPTGSAGRWGAPGVMVSLGIEVLWAP